MKLEIKHPTIHTQIVLDRVAKHIHDFERTTQRLDEDYSCSTFINRYEDITKQAVRSLETLLHASTWDYQVRCNAPAWENRFANHTIDDIFYDDF